MSEQTRKVLSLDDIRNKYQDIIEETEKEEYDYKRLKMKSVGLRGYLSTVTLQVQTYIQAGRAKELGNIDGVLEIDK